MINALDGVPLPLIRRSVHPSKMVSVPYDTPSLDTPIALMDAYRKGLTGAQAVWVTMAWGNRLDLKAVTTRCAQLEPNEPGWNWP